MDENARCKNCKWWREGVMPIYHDKAIPKGWGDCELGESEGNKPMIKKTLAYANDYESYAARLQTSPNFGCIQFILKVEGK
jgi:hypothetical protein